MINNKHTNYIKEQYPIRLSKHDLPKVVIAIGCSTEEINTILGNRTLIIQDTNDFEMIEKITKDLIYNNNDDKLYLIQTNSIYFLKFFYGNEIIAKIKNQFFNFKQFDPFLNFLSITESDFNSIHKFDSLIDCYVDTMTDEDFNLGS